MKKQIFVLVSIVGLLAVNAAFCAWTLKIDNESKKSAGGEAEFATAFCSDDRFDLAPGASTSIGAGICDLVRVRLDSGATYTGDNPVNGLKIIDNKYGKQTIVAK